MPFKSEAQRRYLYSQKPEIATKWRRESGTKSQLPERAGKKKKSSSLIAAYVAGGKKLNR